MGASDQAVDVADGLHRTTRAMLMINADNATALNTRKRLVQLGFLDWQSELSLLNLLLTAHPKSAELWSHRLWLIKTQAGGGVALWEEEAAACQLASERYPRNYYAWTHRRSMLALAAAQDLVEAFVGPELLRSGAWIALHAADYSGWHYRQNLLLTAEKGSCSAMLTERMDREVELLASFLSAAPTHDSLWSHARFIMYTLRNSVQRPPAAVMQAA